MFVNKEPFNRFIEIWLYTLLTLITLIIIIGGLTRLTESGLSITEWELFKGIFPPLNDASWNIYFEQYKQIPEYKEENYNMTLDEFKIIYFWEYGHRILARIIGLVSVIPLFYIYFKYRKNFNKFLKYFYIFLLICFQGFIGWFMVKSGLVENTDVSHFRLALHLSIAFLILSLIFWYILDILKVDKFKVKISQKFLKVFFLLIIIQIILGAFLAGLNGGLIYNTWPDMNGSFYPNDSKLVDLFYFNSLNNPSVVQFYHRIIAYIVIIFLIFLNFIYFKNNLQAKSIILLNLAITFQIILGIITLLTGVKIYYASLHQLGSVFVLTSFLFIYYKNTN